MKILFCINVLFGLLNPIASNEEVFNSVSLKERRSFFETEDGSIPPYEIVEMVLPSRSKRSHEGPVHLTFNAFGTFLTLYGVEDRDLISRGLTGVWIAVNNSEAYQNVEYHPWPRALETIGDIEFFQNIEEGSAVTKFRDSNGDETILGILKQNYMVKSVPKEFEYAFIDISQRHVSRQPFLDATKDQDEKRLPLAIFKGVEVPEKYFRSYAFEHEALANHGLHRVRRLNAYPTKVPDIVYPKLLILPDTSALTAYENYLDFLKQLIARFHSVNVMFRQLKDPEIHLCITGIILPLDPEATPYITRHTNSEYQVDALSALYDTETNFQYETHRFPIQDWHSIVILTTNHIRAYDNATRKMETINGLSSLGKSCGGAAVISTFTENMESVYTLGHELGHLFGARHDEVQGAPEKCKDTDGYLMVSHYGHSHKLEWSPCSLVAFKNYFRSGLGYCSYHRPEEMPDALINMPGAWMSISGQCDNLYNDSEDSCTHDNQCECSTFGCKRNGECDRMNNRLMEGTFVYNDDNEIKACINQTWVSV